MTFKKTDPSQFYTGLISELYAPLVSERASAAQYVPFIDRSGQPVLEPFCGSGAPMIELMELGYDIDGLDASADMLERLQASAKSRGLSPKLYHQEIQKMDLSRRYRSIFIAGASMILLASDEDAQQALQRMYDHLEPGGSVLIPLELQSEKAMRAAIDKFVERNLDDRTILRCGSVSVQYDEVRRQAVSRLRYERVSPSGKVESLERDWQLRWWDQGLFRGMLREAGFDHITCVDEKGNRAAADAAFFIFLAQKSETHVSQADADFSAH